VRTGADHIVGLYIGRGRGESMEYWSTAVGLSFLAELTADEFVVKINILIVITSYQTPVGRSVGQSIALTVCYFKSKRLCDVNGGWTHIPIRVQLVMELQNSIILITG